MASDNSLAIYFSSETVGVMVIVRGKFKARVTVALSKTKQEITAAWMLRDRCFSPSLAG